MSFFDTFKGKQLKTEIDDLKQELEKANRKLEVLGAIEFFDKEKELQKLINEAGLEVSQKKTEISDLQGQLYSLRDDITQADNYLMSLKKEILVLEDEVSFESFALYKSHFEFSNSEEYKAKLLQIRDQQKRLVKSGYAATGNQNWVVNNSNLQGRKMVDDTTKLVLRSFNNECDYCVDNVKFNTVESNEKRINKSFETLNKLGKIMSVAISDDYYRLKLQELYLAHEYQLKKQEEKEERKRIREELKEQAKLEQEIKQAREKISKERKHFSKAIEDIKDKINNTIDENELKQLNKKLTELLSSLRELDNEESLIDYREKNAKAGYVYVISNIGSFGENIYKIGMTRRLEPMDRIDELGDASVPFNFDVHAMIFSDDAPALESALHKAFECKKLNMINHRREFFNVTLDEIEATIKANFDKTVDVVKTPEAEQYRESLLIRGNK